MSDLVICKLSDCSSSVAGGKEIILLCEKVAKEDISVRLFEERDGHTVWEGFGDFTPTHVHKQVAIAFRTPKYRTLEVECPIQVFIQLRRPSDGATSESLPFQLTPLDSGRSAFWSLRRGNKGDYRTFTSILQADTRLLTRVDPKPQQPVVITLDSGSDQQDTNNNQPPRAPTPDFPKINDAYSILKKNKETSAMEAENKVVTNVDSVSNQHFMELPPLENLPPELTQADDQKLTDVINMNDDMEQGFNDLMDQVNELDEMINSNVEPDTGIYTSLQLAMKNPCEFIDFSQMSGYEDVLPPRPTTSKPLVNTPEPKPVMDRSDEILPPLPPKRAKKTPTLTKNLPPVPEGKKLSIFQKLFSSKRKDKSRKSSISSMNSKKSADEKSIVAENDGLTEAEHYALYTSFAPHATASEFDEMSFYYSPVEGVAGNNNVPVQ